MDILTPTPTPISTQAGDFGIAISYSEWLAGNSETNWK